MKPAANNQRIHGIAERSAFSWLFDGWLVAMPKDDEERDEGRDEERDEERDETSCEPGHYQHVTAEHLQARIKTPDASRALKNLLKVQSRRRVRVAFYIPYKFKREYKARFQTLAPKEKFWAEDYRFCGQVMSLVPLPSFLGHTALRDDELSSK